MKNQPGFNPKVFCIGFHKTGTTSLNSALQQLGYRVTGPNGVHNTDLKKNLTNMCIKLVPLFDAFVDNPWPIVYQQMDKLFPESKFILTIRDPEKWYDSIINHFGDKSTPMRELIYGFGSPVGHQLTYIKRYNEHNREVKAFFSDRPEDLLIFDITNGDGWDKLCHFLNKPVVNNAFPCKNKAENRNHQYSEK